MTHSEYNGWTNYETWCANLWLDNDGASEMIREWAEEMDKDDEKDSRASDLADRIKEYVEEFQPEVTGMYADLLNAALQEIDWYEIAEHYIDEAE